MLRVLLFCFVAVSFTPQDGASASLDELFEASGIVGMSVATVAEGQVQETRHFGVRNAETGVPVDDRTVFEAASLSKPVVAYMTLRLVDRGEFDLDVPLWDHFEYDRLIDDPLAREITPRMVLTHTSGLPNWGGTPLVRNFEPGEGWGYSGEGYVFLARALEVKTGERLEELVRREVFEPLGMEQSSFVWQEAYDSDSATGHDLIGDPVEKRRPESENAAASLHTTAREYALFLAAVLEGRGLSPEIFEEMLQAGGQVEGWGPDEAAEHLQWGLGWGLQPGDAGTSIWHWGDNGVFRCFVIGSPATREGVVYFTNSQVGLGILEDFLALYSRDIQWSARWLDYARYDDPAQQARIEVRRAFVHEGADAGWKMLEEFEAETGEAVDEDEILSLGGFLRNHDMGDRAAVLLERVTATRPTAPLLQSLGMTRTALGEHEVALVDLERALETDPSLTEDLQPRIDWLREGLALEARGEGATVQDLQRVAGQYGGRLLVLDDGVLYYSREGATERTRLLPLTPTDYRLEGNHWFRIRVDLDESGRGRAVEGLYADGRVDRTDRE
jgi:CubicO group peptidase (beta-lactamase class C family)